MNDTQDKQKLIDSALALFAQALQALTKAGIVDPQALIAPPATNTLVGGDVDGDATIGKEAAPVLTGTQEALAAALAPSAPVLPQRGAGGKFLKRDGSKGEALATSPAPKAPRPPKPVKPAKVPPKYPAPDTVDAFVEWFFKTPQDGLYSCKCGQYEVRTGNQTTGIAHVLLFHSTVQNETRERDRTGKEIVHKERVDPENGNNIIGIRPWSTPLGVFNANRLLYGRFRAEQLRPQVAAERAGAVPVPFENVVAKSGGAGLDLSKLEIVNWAGAEDMIIPPVERGIQWKGKFFVIKRHFAGALVLRVEDKYFLFDADREELTHCGFNPFFTQLPAAATTVAEAYDLLMPPEARQAKAENREVLRQGEFFFIRQEDHEMKAAVANNMTPGSNVNLRQFMRLTEDFRDVGDTHYMWMAVERAREIEAFIERCKNSPACQGFLPAGMPDTTFPVNEDSAIERVACSDVNAEAVLLPIVRRYYDFSRMSAEAVAVVNDENVIVRTIREYQEKPKSTQKGLKEMIQSLAAVWVGRVNFRDQHSGPVDYHNHMHEVAEELVRSCGAAPTGNIPGPVRPQGDMAHMFSVYFGVRLGKEGDTATTNAHVATGTMLCKNGDIYAIGAVTHSGREHRPLHLPGWYKVVSNTATANWTVSGAVD